MIRFHVSSVVKATAIIVAFGALGIMAYLQHPLFGKLPQGERLARIAQSPNHADGVFHNQIDTPMLTTDESQLSVMLSDTFGEKGNRRPQDVIPAVKTDLKALDSTQDLVIWLGHSSYFVQLGGRRILIDPVFSTNAAPVPMANVAFDGTSLYAEDDMPEVDVLLISHDHYDRRLQPDPHRRHRPMVASVANPRTNPARRQQNRLPRGLARS